MKKILITLILAFSFLNVTQAQTSPFQGTWKWENGNEILYVYIQRKITSEKYLNLDYKVVNNETNTEYSSKLNENFIGIGAFLSEGTDSASGVIFDKTHPNITDFYEGRINLQLINNTTLKWELLPPREGGVLKFSTIPNPPTDFNLPKNIVLTRVIGGIQDGG